MADAPIPHGWQSAAAEAFARLGGVVVDREPGSGKTYAAALIARQCARPLVVAPASVIPQTMAMFVQYGAGSCHYPAHPDITAGVSFASYTWLTRAAQHDFFERYAPTDILMDEFHEARGLNNSARKRLERYLVANPAVRVGVFSASLVTDRVTDFGHALTWALRGRARGLVPPTRAGLEALQAQFDEDPVAWGRFLARLDSTEGVFRDGDGVGRYDGEVVVRVLRRDPALVLNDAWELPDGYLLTSASQAAEVSKMLAWGYWPRVTPRPSEAYLEARRRWSYVVRDVLATGAADTDAQVRALRPEAYAAYVEAEDAEPRGTEEAVWVEGAALRALPDLVPSGHHTIVWCHHRELQRAAADALDCPHHGPKGRDADGVRLDETRESLVVASIEACHAGFNCQAFDHSLVLEPPSDPEVWRQLIGRTARQGQTARRVSVDVVVNCSASENALRTAIARARVSGKPNPILQLDGQDW